ncbi:MAG: MBL fold metallo-hydrolase [Armatimonadota bacterium]|nr:MBL fold metallo-hydrolase [Armatimonadota bacterium]MDR7438921.1 MBL fold metallo-hydrolase [Armatimonadota bacterium]MDR7562461.1 MBL fold metallo-hydrolase [Armatimonadota bacterium]MDR7567049.1 MBL fold metallo-hydrolase [Armatimonadota bacterium]MDR7601174.1 MBL fold metallo-hydrolase [Armatimonadota bacterium]
MSVELVLLGTGVIRPDPERSGPATLLRFGEERILVDCAEGTTLQLLRAGIPPQQVKTVFFTHLHADHILGYPYFVIAGWSDGRRVLRVYGPPGTARMHALLFEELLAEDLAYRVSTGRPPNGLLRDVAVHELSPGPVGYPGDVKVFAFETVHSACNLAYRFEHPEGCVVVSGDTAYFEPLSEFARGADVFVLECSLVEGARRTVYRGPEGERVWQHLQTQHLTAREAGLLARSAGIPRLVLNHLPRGVDPEEIAAEIRTVYDGEVIVGEDLLVVPLRGSVRRKSG